LPHPSSAVHAATEATRGRQLLSLFLGRRCRSSTPPSLAAPHLPQSCSPCCTHKPHCSCSAFSQRPVTDRSPRADQAAITAVSPAATAPHLARTQPGATSFSRRHQACNLATKKKYGWAEEKTKKKLKRRNKELESKTECTGQSQLLKSRLSRRVDHGVKMVKAPTWVFKINLGV
jgi:hypothetical protein